MSMSQKIKDAMKKRGMTQAEVAAATGMQPTMLARMLRDDDHNYTLKTLARIAAALDMDLRVDLNPPATSLTGIASGVFTASDVRIAYEDSDGIVSGRITGPSGNSGWAPLVSSGIKSAHISHKHIDMKDST